MNHDQNNPDLSSWIEPELEARVVAWVAGEASPFEIAELERLVREKPELAIFKRRIEAVHGLIGEASRPDQKPYVLSPERRAKLLAAIGESPASAADQTFAPEKVVVLENARRKDWRRQQWMVGLAACAVLAVLATIKLQEASRMTFSMSESVILDGNQRTEHQREKEAKHEAVDGLKRRGRGPDAPSLEPVPPPAAHSPEPPRVAVQADTVADREATQKYLAEKEARSTSYEYAGGRYEKPASTGTAKPKRPGDLSVTFGAADLSARSSTSKAKMDESLSFDRPLVSHSESGQLTTVSGRNSLLKDDRDVQAGSAGEKGKFILSSSVSKAVPASGEAINFSYVGSVPMDVVTASAVPLGARNVISADAFGDLATSGLSAAELKLGGLPANVSNTPASASTSTTQSDSVVVQSKEITLSAFRVTGGSDRQSANTKNGVSGASANVGRIAQSAPPQKGYLEAMQPEQMKSPSIPKLAAPVDSETKASEEPVSTFSLHVSDVSFRLAQAWLAATERGEDPDDPEIRIEEFYNAFDYGDPAPAPAEKVVARIEQSAHPVLQQRNLVRIAMKVPATGRGAAQPLRLTVLLDTSGSMEREDRRAAVRRALQELIALLGPNDRITLIGFARQSRLLAENIRGNQAGWVLDVAMRTPPEGGTNLEGALRLGIEMARRHRDPAAQNRIVVLTDGAANLGNADPVQLTALVESVRQQGFAFDAAGIGLEGGGDAVLEALTRKGNGRYYVVDSAESADAAFARKLAGAFRPAAENVKLQVRFNPSRVGNYRLVGFERHRLNEQDFRNDQVDAAELAAEESAVALYQVEALPQGTGELGEVFVRFRDPATGQMVERSWTIAYDPQAPAFDRATPSLQLAGIAALMGEKFASTPLGEDFDLDDLLPVVNGLRGHYPNQRRVEELVTMFNQMRRIISK